MKGAETMYKQLERYRIKNGRVRIAKYGRCSTDEQGKNGYTIKDQLDYIEIFAKENDLIVAEEYVDEGISATLEIDKRKALAQLIEDAKAGKFDVIVVKCLDRFFRNVGEYYAAQKQLQKAGVTWLSIEESDLDPEDVDAAFKINIYLSMAEYEAQKTSKRILFNNKMRVKNKQVIAGAQCFLFPWKVVGEKKNRHLERDMDQADRLYDILDYFEMFHSKSAVLAYHNAKYEQQLGYQTLSNLLTDTLLYGEYKGVADYVEPYITKERFDKIQELIKRNSRQHIETDRVFIFSGLIKCHICGRNLTGNYFLHRDGKTPIFSYRCNHYRINKVCTNKSAINERKIEEQLLDNLEQYVTEAMVRIEEMHEKESPRIDHTKKIEDLKKEMDRLNKMYRKGRIEEDEYDDEYSVLAKDLKKLEADAPPPPKDLSAIKKVAESDYRTIYEALDRPHRKAFWRNIIKEFMIDENRNIVPESIIFF
jgi:DNA invertase Pin-like site-specific DNA recombinase